MQASKIIQVKAGSRIVKTGIKTVTDDYRLYVNNVLKTNRYTNIFGEIVIRTRPLIQDETWVVKRQTIFDYGILRSTAQLNKLSRAYIQKMEELLEDFDVDVDSEIESEETERRFIASIWESIKSFLFGDHTLSAHAPHPDKLPKNPVYGEPDNPTIPIDNSIDIYKEFTYDIDSLPVENSVDQPSGISSYMFDLSLIKSINIENGRITVELWRVIWDPTLERKKAVFKLPFDEIHGIILLDSHKLDNLTIKESTGLLTLSAPYEGGDPKKISVRLNNAWVPLKIALTKQRVLDGY